MQSLPALVPFTSLSDTMALLIDQKQALRTSMVAAKKINITELGVSIIHMFLEASQPSNPHKYTQRPTDIPIH